MKLRTVVTLAAAAAFSSLACGQWAANHDLTTSGLQSQFDTLSAQGYRPVDVTAFSVGGSPRFGVIWERRGSPYYAFYYGMSASGLGAQDSNLASMGYRLVLLDTYKDAGNDRFTAIWERWIGPSRQRETSVPLVQLSAQITHQAANGFHPLRIKVASGISGLVAVILWEQSNQPERKVVWGLTDASITSDLEPHIAEGYRPYRISSYMEGGVGKSLVILEKQAGPPWFIRAGMTSASYQSEFDAQLVQKYRPVSLSGYEVANTARYSAIWNRYERPAIPVGMPVSGLPRSGLEGFDSTMKNFMQERGISAGALCVSKDNTIVYERAFGWQDADYQAPLRKSALFRTASLAKPVTSAAVLKLASMGSLNLGAFVFDLGQTGGGILNIIPAGAPDSRLKDITVQHLLDHRGGWDRGISGDPMFNAYNIALDLGVAMPPAQTDIVRWVAGRPLDHTPGTTYAYSNFGYLLLGLIIEKVTGTDATAWIQSNLFQPLGVTSSEFQLGRSLLNNRNPREPYYHDPGFGSYNVYYPDRHSTWQDGGWNIESMETHGGWVQSTRAYVRFLQNYWINGQPRVGGSANLVFSGALNGTFTVARQLSNGVSYAAFFNQLTDSSGLAYDTIVNVLDMAVAGVSTWPLADPMNEVMVEPGLELVRESPNNLKWLRWTMQPGRIYQILSTQNLQDWQRVGNPVVGGTGTSYSHDVEPLLNVPRMFFRLEVE